MSTGSLPASGTDPLSVSLADQLTRMRGGGELPPALTDIVRERVAGLDLVRPRDWDELRHQEGAEGRGAPYWAQLWPSAEALAGALTERDLEGQSVLELGCGLALPAVVAASRGARVLAVDGVSDAVVFAAHNLAINDLEGEVALVDWREPSLLLERAPWDLVIASDVLYLRANVEALVPLLPKLTREALISDPSRAGGRDFLAAARGMFDIDSRGDNVRVHTLRKRSL